MKSCFLLRPECAGRTCEEGTVWEMTASLGGLIRQMGGTITKRQTGAEAYEVPH